MKTATGRSKDDATNQCTIDEHGSSPDQHLSSDSAASDQDLRHSDGVLSS